MAIEEYYKVLTDNKKTYLAEWKINNPKAIIILIHGLGEHIRRYDQQIEFFNDHGFGFISADLPGHGKSEGKRGMWESMDELYEVVEGLFKITKDSYKSIPIILYGHSMGGNIAAGYALFRKPEMHGLILTGVAINTPKDMPKPLIRFILSSPRVIKNLVIGSRLNLKSLCNDEEIVKTYIADPLVHDRISLGSGAVILNNAIAIKNATMNNSYPVLIMHGGKDTICFPSGSEVLMNVFAKGTLKIWPGMLHEIHNEPDKRLVWAFTVDWLNDILK
ncbi:MAG: lysophospholipase [Saprospiraceae bacterium]